VQVRKKVSYATFSVVANWGKRLALVLDRVFKGVQERMERAQGARNQNGMSNPTFTDQPLTTPSAAASTSLSPTLLVLLNP
jgi:hypothetical protein